MKTIDRFTQGILAACFASTLSLHAAQRVDGDGLLLDLSKHYTQRFDGENYTGKGHQLPKLNPVFDGLRFNLNGQVTLWGREMAWRGEILPVAIRGVPVNARFDELHLVHHGRWSDAEGQVVARVRLNYADGSRHEYPIRWGYHVRDWSFLPSYETETLGDPNAKVIWRDPAGNNTRYKGFRRLWKTHFMNPHPDRLVRSIDFESAGSNGHYAVISAVVARTDPGREQTRSIPFDQPPRHFDGRLRVTVKDGKTGQPIPRVRIAPAAYTHGVNVVAEHYFTDEQGQAEVRYWKGKTRQLSYRAIAPGYHSKSDYFEGEIPDRIEVRLQPTQGMGGTVVDEAGRPLEGVTVVYHGYATFTDAAGRWKLDTLPTISGRADLSYGHPDYAPSRAQVGRDVTPADLRAGKARLVLARGHEFGGLVRDEAGRPIAGAEVVIGDRNSINRSAPRTRTDRDGRFRFQRLAPGESFLSVKAEGKAATTVAVKVGADNAPVEVKMGPEKIIQGTVRDEDGEPLGGVRVMVFSSREPRALREETRTTPDGQFRLGGLPDEPLQMVAYKEGWFEYRSAIQPGVDKNPRIALIRIRPIRGRVVDARTGKPLPEFSVVVGQTFGNGEVYFVDRPRKFKSGVFEISARYREVGDQIAVRVEADGYLPKVSEVFSVDEPPAQLKIELVRGSGPAGTVLQPDGKPAAGAQVGLTSPGRQLGLRNGVLSASDAYASRVVRADQKGRFRAAPDASPTGIVAVHESGFAHVPIAEFKTTKALRLQPWATVVGTVTDGGRPVAGEMVSFTFRNPVNSPFSLWFDEYPLTTDAEGHVMVHRMPPGELRFFRMIRSEFDGRTMFTYGDSVSVRVEAGKTNLARLDIRLRFRKVIGKVRVRDEERPDLSGVRLELRSSKLIKPPKGVEIPGRPSRGMGLEGKGYIYPHYKLQAGKEGRFQIDRIPAGEYQLMATLMEPWVGQTVPKPVGYVSSRVTIPPGDENVPFDLGVHEILLFLSEGQMAPAFTARTVAGKEFSLAEFRGRYVLLDFWATWCGPCVAETPNLKRVYEEFGQDRRFAMVGLSLDSSPTQPAAYARKNGIKWVNGYLGEWNSQTVTKDYRVYGIPEIMLIGPDGRIVAKDLRGDRIRAAVAKALGNSQ